MTKTYRPRRDFDGLEARRLQAARLFAAGELSQAEVARRLKTSRQSISVWYRLWKKGGAAALKKAGRAGRKPRLSSAELRQLDRALRDGALAHGFSTELWTLPRIAVVIERLTGVEYHPGHVWRILRSLNWSLQRPARRALERNEAEIRRWVREQWPRVKKTPSGAGPGSSLSTRPGSPKHPRSAAPGHPKAAPRP